MIAFNCLLFRKNLTKQRLLITLATVVTILFSPKVFAQNNTVSSGGVASGPSGTISYSVGQVFYESNLGINGKIIQGLEQPYEISIITGLYDTEIDLKLYAYPNPVMDYLTLSITNSEPLIYIYQILDSNGKMLKQEKVGASIISINMNNLNPGIYFLNILFKQKQIKIFKIIKAR